MIRREIRIEQTIASVLAEDERFFAVAEAEIRAQRALLKAYILQRPEFRDSLVPLDVGDPDAPGIVRDMAAAAGKAGVGPMAAVAGALAGLAVRAMAAAGARQCVFDNGGDIALAITEPITIGVFTGPSRIRGLGLRLAPRPGVFSVCTSSGTIGHSLSFGRADAAVAIAGDSCLADAAATALGNAMQGPDPAAFGACLRKLMAAGLEGALAVVDDVLLAGGELPEIVRADVDMRLISGAGSTISMGPGGLAMRAGSTDSATRFWWLLDGREKGVCRERR